MLKEEINILLTEIEKKIKLGLAITVFENALYKLYIKEY